MFVFALNQWCAVLDTLEGQGYLVSLSEGWVSIVLFEEVKAVCQH